MAFNVGALSGASPTPCWKHGDIQVAGQLLRSVAAELGHGIPWEPFTIALPRRAGLAQLSRRADDAQRQLRHHGARLSSPSSCSSRSSRGVPGPVLKLHNGTRECAALWLDRRHRRASISASGTISASRARPRRRKKCARRRASLPYGTMAGMITLLIAAALTWYVVREPAAVAISRRHLTSRSMTRRGSPAARTLKFILFWGTVLSAVASANGCINDAARAWFSLGRDRYLPTWFSAVHPKYRTPYRSILFLMPIALAFAFICGPQPGDHLLDPLGRAAVHVHEHQHRDVPQQVAGGHDPARLYAPLPSAPGDRAVCSSASSRSSRSSWATARSSSAMVAFYILVSLWFHFYRYRTSGAATSSPCRGRGR